MSKERFFNNTRNFIKNNSDEFDFGEYYENYKVVQFTMKENFWLQFVVNNKQTVIQIVSREKLSPEFGFSYSKYWGFYYKNIITFEDSEQPFDNDLKDKIIKNDTLKKLNQRFNKI